MKKMRGVALVTALLVVALASMAATALMSTTSLSIHRTEALRDTEAAWWVARGVEAWVIGILKDDKREYDGFDEPWAQPVDGLPIEQGSLRGHIVDLQGRFNLNSLLLPASDLDQAKYEAHFRQLLAQLPGDLEIPPGLIGAIRDWGDADQNPAYPDGAEDGAYQGLDPGYRTADRPFTVVSELLAVKGITPKLYDALKDLVAALPEAKTSINVNTAPEAVLLAMPGADQAKVHRFVEERKDKPAKARGDFEKEQMFGGGAPPYDVKSRYFQIQGEVFVGSSRVALYSLINRSSTTPTVLAHSADAE